jgi:hypothetical protein
MDSGFFLLFDFFLYLLSPPYDKSIISYFLNFVKKKIKLFFLNIWKVGTIIAES